MKKEHRGSAAGRDIRRSIRREWRRFLSIAVISLLGTMMFSGLMAGCQDLRVSADRFFDEQSLHDLQIVSTGGLTEEDVKALNESEGVKKAEGICTGDINVTVPGKGEDNSGKDGSALSASYVTLTEQGIDLPHVEEGRLPQTGGEAAVTQKFAREAGIERGDRIAVEEGEGAPALSVTAFTVTAIVTDPTSTDNPFSAVSYRTDSSSGETVYLSGRDVDMSVFTAVNCELTGTGNLFSFSDAYDRRVAAAKENIEKAVLPERERERFREIKEEAEKALSQAREETEEQLGKAKETLDASEKKLLDAENEIDGKQAELDEARQYAESQLPEGTELPYLTWSKFNDAQKELDRAREEWTSAWEKYEDGRSEYEKKKEDADAKIRDAAQAVEDLKKPVWYIRTRSGISGYSNIASDADSIEAVGTVFPLVFFVVAFFVCLTTITRMVEEERGLIGTYKSLGFTAREIRRKYLVFAGTACVLGCGAGTAMAFLAFPAFLFTVFRIMYLLPEYVYTFMPLRALTGAGIFLAGVLLAASSACRASLAEVPASLLRPKAPPLGSRIFLEKTSIWRRFSFLGKVTARNLFRYKKRMAMTIFGIGGCMALLLFGYSIKDSVSDLRPRQYSQTFHYDVLAAASGENGDLLKEAIDSAQGVSSSLSFQMQQVQLKMEKEGSETQADREVTVQAVIVPGGEDLAPFISLRSGGEDRTLRDGDVFVTRNAARVLGFGEGENITVQLPDLAEAKVKMTRIVDNYLSNYMYMTAATYEELFQGENYEDNAALIDLTIPASAQAAWADKLAGEDGVMTAVSIEKEREDFEGTFRLMNIIVLIVIAMSALLAFTVLLTLATINISEREREIATMKVLGFYPREVYSYIHRETWILTAIGIAVGMPVGRLFAESLVIILNLPSIYLAVSLHPISYLWSALLCVAFAGAVQIVTNRMLNGIDPVTALKSVE